MPYIIAAMSIMVNIFLIGMVIQADIHPRDNVVIVEADCPVVEAVKCENEVIIEECNPDRELSDCINEKFEYGDQINAIDKIIHPEFYEL